MSYERKRCKRNRQNHKTEVSSDPESRHADIPVSQLYAQPNKKKQADDTPDTGDTCKYGEHGGTKEIEISNVYYNATNERQEEEVDYSNVEKNGNEVDDGDEDGQSGLIYNDVYGT